jgi:hypothetical protein
MRRTELQRAVEAGILSAAQADRLAEFYAELIEARAVR